MIRSRYIPLLLAMAMASAFTSASDVKTVDTSKPQQPAAKNELPAELQGRPPVTKQTRIELIRTMQAEFGFAKRVIPKGEKGLQLTSNGQVAPDEQTVNMQVATYGPAARPGDKLQITNVVIKNSEIVFDLNGGSKKKGHWYDHVEVGAGGGTVPVHQEKGLQNNGCTLQLMFPKYVPEMTATDVKKLLEPVVDFTLKSPTQAYLDTLPPKVKQSIENHQALVGMSKEMVMDALGRPPKRIRETDSNNVDYEEWVYGQPPGEMQFLRFVNDEVFSVEHIQVGGEKVVKTAREIKVNPVTGAATVIDANAPQTAAAAASADAQPTQTAETKKPKAPPTLRRPGEAPEDPKGTPLGRDSGELGSKPIPPAGSTQEPEWGTKPAQSPNTAPQTNSPNAPLPGDGSLPPVNPR